MKWYLLVALGAIAYGVPASLVKLAYKEGYVVDEVIITQFFWGFIFLFIINLIRKIYMSFRKLKETKQLNFKTFLILLVLGTTTGLISALYYMSLQYVNPSITVIFMFQYTWMSIILELLIFKKRPTVRSLVAIIPLLIGTALATNLISGNIEFHILGAVFGLLSGLAYSIFILVSGHIAAEANPVSRATIMVAGGLIICLIVYNPVTLFDIDRFMAYSVNYGMICAIFVPLMAILFISQGAPHIGSAMTAIIGTLELPSIIIFATIILGTEITLVQVIGILLILAAIAYPKIREIQLENKAKI